MSNRNYVSNNLLASLRAARLFQQGAGPLPSYSEIRMLEKKKLIYVYRRLNEDTDYETPNGTVRRRTIYAITLMYDGLVALGIEKPPPPPPSQAWLMD